ncbi:MAG: hypothetical protein RI988_2424 [Pseudomonadota bacterium]|jgi:paraquat-inducible protein B
MSPTLGAAQAFRVGVFALLGLAALVAALVVAGGRGFGATEPAVMRFASSVWGLQVGAPVVLRGVRVGEVTAIGLGAAPAAARASTGLDTRVPVAVSLDARALRPLLGPDGHAAVLPALLERGLVARLSTQSLLTGLLYVDLDFDAAQPGAKGSGEIPTAPTRLQALQAQLEGLDLARMGRELAEVSQGLRQLLAEPEARQALRRTAEAARAVQAASTRLQAQLVPLAESLQGSIEQARRSAAAVEPVAREVSTAARAVAQAASQAGTLAASGAPVLARAQLAADELARAAASLSAMTAEDSSLRRRTDEALVEAARAAKALRELAELLEKHPEAILRGRR